MTTKLPAVPEGYHTVTPWIISRDSAKLLDFMKEAFGAEEQEGSRVYNPDGSVGHAETRIGDSVIMAFDSKPDWMDSPAFFRLYVADGDATFQRALKAGATAVTEMTDMAWGDRVGRVRDPFGNVWWIMSRVEEVPLDEMQKRMSEPKWQAAMAYVQSARILPGKT